MFKLLRGIRNAVLALLLSGATSLASPLITTSALAAPATPPAPVLTVVMPVAPDTHITFTFEGQPSDTFFCSIDGGAYFECAATYLYDYTDAATHTLNYYLEQPNRTTSLIGSYTWYDRVAPVTPVITGLDATTDSSTLGDNLTSSKQPRINLENLEVGATVNLEFYTGETLAATCSFTAAAATGYCLPTSQLTDGVYTVQAWQLDAEENLSELASHNFVVDTTAPNDPDFHLADVSNTGLKTDAKTTSRNPILEILGLETGVHYVVTVTSAGHPTQTCDFIAADPHQDCTLLNLAIADWNVSISSEDEAGNKAVAVTGALTILKATSGGTGNASGSNTADGSDAANQGSEEPTVEPTPEPSPTPSPTPTDSSSGNGKGGADGSDNSESDQGAPFDPMGSEASIQDVNQATTIAMALVAAIAAAGSRRGNSKKGSKSAVAEEVSQTDAGIESIEVELRDFEVDKEGVGDALPMFDNRLFTAIDQPSHNATMAISTISPVVAKIFNDGAYLRAIGGVLSLVAPVVGVVLGLLAIGTPSEHFVPPLFWVFLAISVLGIFDAMAGAVASLIYAVGALAAHSQFNALTANDLRLVLGVFIVGFGPSLLASAFREFRRPAEHGGVYWWERITDFVIVPLLGYLTVSSMIGALPALAGIKLDVANAATEFGLAIAAALILRVALEELAARAFPKRLNELHPSAFPERPIWMQAVSLLARTGVFVFVSASLLGNYWQTWVGCALMMIPTIAGWFADRWPNSVWLWRLIPQGVPGMITALLIGLGASLLVNSSLGVTPEYARWSFVLMQMPMIAFSILGLFGRHGKAGEVRWNQNPKLGWLYRLGGVAMLGWVLLLTGII